MAVSPIIVEYVFLGGQNTHHDFRSKARTIYVRTESAQSVPEASDLPEWNFDGSSTGQMAKMTDQGTTLDTEILIRPVRVFKHPFLPSDAALPAFVCLCETYYPDGRPTICNTRVLANEVFKRDLDSKPWFGLEQEYVLYKNGQPLGWPTDGSEPAAQGPYYCGTGVNNAHGREHAMLHYTTCIKMGIKLAGLNAEVMPGQWEYQVGPCEGIEAGDHVVMARWVYLRLMEQQGVDVNFNSKPKKGDWNGSGMHTNFSTLKMREANGMSEIKEALSRLAKTYLSDICYYGQDNNERLSGIHETSKYDEFSHGVGTRHTSCRVPNQVEKDGHGYFEDRRPSSSADPYLVTARLFGSSQGIAAPAFDALTAKLTPAWLTVDENKK